MRITNQQIAEYIQSQDLAWSKATIRSETARLRSIAPHLDGNPSTLWAALLARGTKPYSRLTAWTRVVRLVDWLIATGAYPAPNQYKEFRRANALQFKHVYVRRQPAQTFEQAEAIIQTLRPDVRRRALEILYSGLRYQESATHNAGRVVGKGGKERAVYVPDVTGPELTSGYATFWRHLAAVGLKPHDLRKLALTRLVELGANEFDLCAIAGWSSLAPALSYVKVSPAKITGLMSQLRKVKAG